MQQVFKRRAFQYVAALAIAASFGAVRVRPRLLELPESLVCDLLEAVGDRKAGRKREDRGRVLNLFAGDPRDSVRVRVADALGALAWEGSSDSMRLLEALATDPSPLVRSAAAHGLENVLESAAPIDRIEIVCRWATAAEAAQREALARALCSAVPTPVTDLVLAQLAADADARVRLSAIRASERHFADHPASYSEIAESCAMDSNRRVRRAARRLLSRNA
jgi:HEAT repeat protein